MDVFNALWDNAEQRKRPPDDDFQLFTMEEWMAKSTTHKILSGSFRCPLPPEIELPEESAKPDRGTPKSFQNRKDKSWKEAGPSGATQQNKLQGEVYVPGLHKFPDMGQRSSLTRDEQRDCLQLLLKFHGRSPENLTPAEKAEYQLFQSLYSRAIEEQKKFLERAKQDWPEFINRVSRLKGDQNTFFRLHWKNKVTRMMAQYPKRYRKLRMVSLAHKTTTPLQLHLIKNILNMGKIPMVKLPQFVEPFRVATSIIKLRNWGYFNIPSSQLEGTLHKVPVSRDPNAERLARLHGANIVISSGGLKCLLDNYDSNRHPHPSGVGQSWSLPITVRDHRSFCDGKPVTKTIVFIDKPWPQPMMTSFEKVVWYHKHALKAAVVHRFQVGGIEFEIKGDDYFTVKEPVANCKNFTSSGSVPSSVNQSADIDSSPVTNVTPTVLDSPAQFHESSSDDSEDEDGLMIDLNDSETTSPKKSLTDIVSMETIQKSVPLTKTDSDPGLVSVDCQGRNMDSVHSNVKDDDTKAEVEVKSTNSVSSESVPTASQSADSTLINKWENVPALSPIKIINGNALPLCDTNLTYNLWSLQPEETNPPVQLASPASNEKINLLIRSRVDGCESFGKGNFEPLSLACKPEYQPEYSAGALSLSELTRQWAKLRIQPSTHLARVRVFASRAEMIKMDKLSREDVEHEAQTLHSVDLKDTLLTLHEVLKDVLKLECGEYVLHHTPAMGLSAELHKKSEEGKPTDLHLSSLYGDLPKDIDCDIPWQPLDPTVILPKHLHFNCMPCSFAAGWTPKTMNKPRKPQVKLAVVKLSKAQKNKLKKNKKKQQKQADLNQ